MVGQPDHGCSTEEVQCPRCNFSTPPEDAARWRHCLGFTPDVRRTTTGFATRPTRAPRLGQGRCAPSLTPHQLHHAHAVEMAREGVSLKVIQRQLGHVNLGITSVYLDGIDTAEIIDTVHTGGRP
jgi:integrase